MAKTYTTTIEINCRKEHTCVGCGAIYSYPFYRKVTGSSGSAEQARLNCQANVTKAMANEVDQHPCPTCGLYQPDMIGQARRGRHLLVLWLGIIAFVVLVSMRLGNAFPANEATNMLAIAAGAVLVLHALIDLKNPNKDLLGNATRAGQGIVEGKIQHIPGRAGEVAEELVNPPKSSAHRLAMPMLIIGAGLILLPEMMRSVNHWPVNADCYPPVVGAGDTTRIYMDQTIRSVKSYWRGSAKVELRRPGGVKPILASAKTNDKTWGSIISAKSSETSESSRPWVEVTMPGDNLAGQTVDCSIKLDVSYPESAGSKNFAAVQKMMSRNVSIHFASPGAGAKYDSMWWMATGAGVVLAVIAGIILVGAATGLRKRATPTRVFA